MVALNPIQTESKVYSLNSLESHSKESWKRMAQFWIFKSDILIKSFSRKSRNQKFPGEKITRTYDWKDDDSREHRREAIRQADHDGVTVTIIIHWVVRRERYQTAES